MSAEERLPDAGRSPPQWGDLVLPFTEPDPWLVGPPLTGRIRFAFVVAVSLVSGAAAAWLIGREGFTSDLLHVWFATRTMLSGGDPYSVPLPENLNPGLDPALYPATSYLIFAPIAWLPLALSGGAFVAAGSALAAWGVSRTGMARATLFVSAPFLLAVSLGQWSPLLLGAILVPGASWLLVAKPNIGLAAWLATPRWKTALAILLFTALSVAIYPSWPAAWLRNLVGREEKLVPLLQPGGFLLLAAIVAWRRAEGRLLLTMSLIPQALFFYDQLLLWLIPRTLRQSLFLSIASFCAFLAWHYTRAPGDRTVNGAVPFAQSLYYAAAAVLLWNWWRDRRPRTT